MKDLKIGFTDEPIVLTGASDVIIHDTQVRLRHPRTGAQGEQDGFLDIWRETEKRYEMAAITLIDCHNIHVIGCDLRYNQIGLQAYNCSGLKANRNDVSHNSAWGFALHGVTYSLFQHNAADYCCRMGDGHFGGDAAGFLLTRGSSHNWFHDNTARMGGDGFFLAGYHHAGGLLAPCNYNEFRRNDVGWSPNNGFEETFCIGNSYFDNTMEGCRYGFWLGYATGANVAGNTISRCQLGIGIENSRNGVVRSNKFYEDRRGWAVWSRWYPWAEQFPQHQTSAHWLIEDNGYFQNAYMPIVQRNCSHGWLPAPGDAPMPHAIACTDTEFSERGGT